jgi:hypothetical protein
MAQSIWPARRRYCLAVRMPAPDGPLRSLFANPNGLPRGTITESITRGDTQHNPVQFDPPRGVTDHHRKVVASMNTSLVELACRVDAEMLKLTEMVGQATIDLDPTGWRKGAAQLVFESIRRDNRIAVGPVSE